MSLAEQALRALWELVPADWRRRTTSLSSCNDPRDHHTNGAGGCPGIA